MIDVWPPCVCGGSFLEFDGLQRLTSLTYLGVDAVETRNLTALVGLFDAQLSGVGRMYAAGHIRDFIECVVLVGVVGVVVVVVWVLVVAAVEVCVCGWVGVRVCAVLPRL